MVDSLSEGTTSDSTSAKKADSRPSFTDYWKRTKQAARQITFVSSSLEQSAGPNEDDHHQQRQQEADPSGPPKSQARRAQVRKAQIQHRQRKANYTKQLEMDVAELRDLIARAENESLLLRGENEAIRRRLLRANVNVNVNVNVNERIPQLELPGLDFLPPEMDAYSASPEYMINFLSDTGELGTPVYQVQRASMPSFPSAMAPLSADVAPGRDEKGLAQADYAVNFILGLEHVCWDHFHPSHYEHEHYDPESAENGHALMATSLALQSAPAGVWEQIDAEKERRKQSTNPNPNPNPTTFSSTVASQPPILPPLPFADNNDNGNNGSTQNNTTDNSTNINNNNILASWQITPPPPSPSTNLNLSTQPNPASAGLTLEGLHGLASTLNPGDGTELAPVQAWFEMMRLYGGALLRDTTLVDRVRVELAAVVECVYFGAVIQRGVFEDVLERVLGPVPGTEDPGGRGGGGGYI